MRDIVHDMTRRIFEDHVTDATIRAGRGGDHDWHGWNALAEAGLPLALVDEAAGGFGLDPADALDCVRIGAGWASPVPLGETLVANYLLTRAGLPPAEGRATFASLADAELGPRGGGVNVRGRAFGVPWADAAEIVVAVADGLVLRLPAAECALEPSPSLSMLPRHLVSVDLFLDQGAAAPCPGIDEEWLRFAGAAIRTLEIAGALEQVLAMTVDYASQRIQFGKSIGRQQAIQQSLAILAGQTAAAMAAAAIAASAFGRADGRLALAAAKSRAGEAAGIGAAIAHQVHGAIGFTEEHRLHLFTRALWHWRDEYGSERAWNEMLGEQALAAGNQGLWPMVTAAIQATS